MINLRTTGIILLISTFFLGGCIENDLPYPVIKAVIEDIETEGLFSSTINKETMEVSILVDDTIDLRDLLVTKLQLTSGTLILPDTAACLDYINFPDSGFLSLQDLPSTANTRINFTKDVTFTLRIYQDYIWKISVAHNIERKFEIKDSSGKKIRVGSPIVDEHNKKILIYVNKDADLSDLRIDAMQIGSSIATTKPLPQSITDFREPKIFEVSAFGKTEQWEVTITHSTGSGLTVSSWAKRAYIMGDANENTLIDIQYRKKGEEYWDKVYSDEITFQDGSFTTIIRHLVPSSIYEYEATIGSQKFSLSEFKTDTVQQLPNSGFEDWHKPDKVWLIYKENENMFWDSGNWGSATLNKNVTNYDESTYHEGKRSAKLTSEYLVIRFAAGNIFTGEYLETDGTNGILDFGRPFTSRPTSVKGWFKYTTSPITRVESGDPIEEAQKGMDDKAHIYVAVGDWDSPVRIRTKKSERKLFDPNDSHIIAYQELTVDKTVSSWTQFKLDLDYRSLTRTPKYIVFVATASKYGDYFTGGEGSTLWLDDIELVYE